MFKILQDKTICLTRGDIANIEVSAMNRDGQPYMFQTGNVVQLLVYKKREPSSVVINKKVTVGEPSEIASIHLEKEDTRFGNPICSPVEYWYEIAVNPDTEPQTIIGYDEAGEKIFRLYPEGIEKA